MNFHQINGDHLREIGFPQGRAIGVALVAIEKHFRSHTREEVMDMLTNLAQSPADFLDDTYLSAVADLLMEKPKATAAEEIPLRDEAAPYAVYGGEKIEQGAVNQMNIAVRLPVAVAGALMPDAHQGYGLPIGGVLATENAVIPYGVGVDIGCRMCMSLFDLNVHELQTNKNGFVKLLNQNTLFGSGKEFSDTYDNEVLDRHEFQSTTLLKSLHHKAVKQLGTSGSGNHFVEFGVVEVYAGNGQFDVPAGTYLALLSHSGSRGLGATIAQHYTKLAMEKCPLPKDARHLAWLDLNTEEGQEYWLSMNLAGDYASACHHVIHEKMAKSLAMQPVAMIENHHNFAWKEQLNGREVIVHRKGATPAGKNVLGIIPGSMSAPGFIVRGKGESDSIHSASHGAGRQMSRTSAIKNIPEKELRQMLADNGVTLIGGGLDEAPQAYKDIHGVMQAQQELVEVLGRFDPKIVRMDS
ncbi:MAG: RtcB family protein [Bacteroidia bacterium]|jgi:tRNA-splicing ligase RtcB|nr:RtcB family protein [Bacteroidia bacterium]